MRMQQKNLQSIFWCTRDPEFGFNIAKGGAHIPVSKKRNPWDRPEYRAMMEKKVLPLLRVTGNSPEAKANNRLTRQTKEYKEKQSLYGKKQYLADSSNLVKGRQIKTHCKNGHLFNSINKHISVYKINNVCKICRRARERARYAIHGKVDPTTAPRTKTHCTNGHLLSGPNLRIRIRKVKIHGITELVERSHRVCIACSRV